MIAVFLFAFCVGCYGLNFASPTNIEEETTPLCKTKVFIRTPSENYYIHLTTIQHDNEEYIVVTTHRGVSVLPKKR